MGDLTGRPTPARPITTGKLLDTKSVRVNFGPGHTIRAYADLESLADETDPSSLQQIIADVTLPNVPEGISVCFRGPLDPTSVGTPARPDVLRQHADGERGRVQLRHRSGRALQPARHQRVHPRSEVRRPRSDRGPRRHVQRSEGRPRHVRDRRQDHLRRLRDGQRRRSRSDPRRHRPDQVRRRQLRRRRPSGFASPPWDFGTEGDIQDFPGPLGTGQEIRLRVTDSLHPRRGNTRRNGCDGQPAELLVRQGLLSRAAQRASRLQDVLLLRATRGHNLHLHPGELRPRRHCQPAARRHRGRQRAEAHRVPPRRLRQAARLGAAHAHQGPDAGRQRQVPQPVRPGPLGPRRRQLRPAATPRRLGIDEDAERKRHLRGRYAGRLEGPGRDQPERTDRRSQGNPAARAGGRQRLVELERRPARRAVAAADVQGRRINRVARRGARRPPPGRAGVGDRRPSPDLRRHRSGRRPRRREQGRRQGHQVPLRRAQRERHGRRNDRRSRGDDLPRGRQADPDDRRRPDVHARLRYSG